MKAGSPLPSKPLVPAMHALALASLLVACGSAPRSAPVDSSRIPPPGVYSFSIEVAATNQLRDRQERIRETVFGHVSVSDDGAILVDTSHGGCRGSFAGPPPARRMDCHGIRASVSGSAERGVFGSVTIPIQERIVVRGPCLQFADEARTRCLEWSWTETYRTVWRGGSFRSAPTRSSDP